MNKAFRYYNQNRFKIMVIIILIVLGIIILRSINYIVVKKNKKEFAEELNNIELARNKENTTLYSITTGEKQENAKKTTGTIQKFIDYCNKKDITNAYSMLSEECKKEMFPAEEDFRNLYWQSKFLTEKNLKIENWRDKTYKIYLTENMLSTGKKSTVEIQDYITITNESGKNKLNINSFIENKKLEKSAESNNILVRLIEKSTYMDYEIYTFKIKNNRESNILLDDCKKADSIYITDVNGTKHVAYMHELLPELLNIKSKEEMEIKIKFANAYISNRTLSTITFSNIIIDNDKSVSLKVEL